MTEREWFTVVDPESMLTWVGPRCSERKLRLFAAACCRRVARHCRDRFESVLAKAEEIADSAGTAATAPRLAALWMTREESTLAHALSEVNRLHAARQACEAAVALARAKGDTWWEERWFQAAFLCDVVGNPFRSVSFATPWRTTTVEQLAREMYGSRDFSAMPILADALQEAGCENADVLGHCRDPHAAHVRGCWVVDLVLGKS